MNAIFKRPGWAGGPGNPAANRSNNAEVRNPLLALPAMRSIRLLPPDVRACLAALLRDLAADANDRANAAWRRHKAPMAAYWKAVAVYARHTARAIQRGA